MAAKTVRNPRGSGRKRLGRFDVTIPIVGTMTFAGVGAYDEADAIARAFRAYYEKGRRPSVVYDPVTTQLLGLPQEIKDVPLKPIAKRLADPEVPKHPPRPKPAQLRTLPSPPGTARRA